MTWLAYLAIATGLAHGLGEYHSQLASWFNVSRSIALCMVLAGAWSRWGWEVAFVVVGGIWFVDATLARTQLLVIKLAELKGWLPNPDQKKSP